MLIHCHLFDFIPFVFPRWSFCTALSTLCCLDNMLSAASYRTLYVYFIVFLLFKHTLCSVFGILCHSGTFRFNGSLLSSLQLFLFSVLIIFPPHLYTFLNRVKNIYIFSYLQYLHFLLCFSFLVTS